MDAQKRSLKMRSNTAAIATFFAGVSASTLQFSAQINESRIRTATSALWFTSLVLSIGSAIVALLSMTWKHAVL